MMLHRECNVKTICKGCKATMYLRVNQQRPAPSFANNDGIVNREAVIGQALNDPFPNEHGIP